MKKNDVFVDYYQRELTYLRQSGKHFAHKYPKIAKRLDFTDVESTDPHVERLLESFAYLTARLQKDTDDQFPRLSGSLLEILYPQFTHPIPSFAIAKFDAYTQGGKSTSSTLIAKHTPLFTRINDNTICRFKTVYPLEIPPIEITQVSVVSNHDYQNTVSGHQLASQYLKLQIRSLAGSFATINLDKLRFYIAGNRTIKTTLIEGILTAGQPSLIHDKLHQTIKLIQPSSLSHVGFDDSQTVLPYHTPTHAGYRLLFEMFHFPEKFFFIDLIDPALSIDTAEIDILLPLQTSVPLDTKDVNLQNVMLNCTPIINLFNKTSEPLNLTHRAHEYRLVSDQRLEASTEIFSIEQMLSTTPGQVDIHHYTPYFSYNHHQDQKNHSKFWTTRRIPHLHDKQDNSSDVMVSFVDLDFDPIDAPAQTIFAKITCTNRQLAHQISPGSLFYPENSSVNHKIYCLDRPSLQRGATLDGQAQWQIISHLSLNHLALSGGPDAVKTLQEIMFLYADHGDSQILTDINALQDVSFQKVTRRLGQEYWRGFVQGTKITLTFNVTENHGNNIFVLTSVLNRFFSLMAAVNSFTQLEVCRSSQQGIWLSWPPLIGNKVFI